MTVNKCINEVIKISSTIESVLIKKFLQGVLEAVDFAFEMQKTINKQKIYYN